MTTWSLGEHMGKRKCHPKEAGFKERTVSLGWEQGALAIPMDSSEDSWYVDFHLGMRARQR